MLHCDAFLRLSLRTFWQFYEKQKQRKELVMAVLRQTQFYLCFLKNGLPYFHDKRTQLYQGNSRETKNCLQKKF